MAQRVTQIQDVLSDCLTVVTFGYGNAMANNFCVSFDEL